jgi:hypothetical protein
MFLYPTSFWNTPNLKAPKKKRNFCAADNPVEINNFLRSHIKHFPICSLITTRTIGSMYIKQLTFMLHEYIILYNLNTIFTVANDDR